MIRARDVLGYLLFILVFAIVIGALYGCGTQDFNVARLQPDAGATPCADHQPR